MAVAKDVLTVSNPEGIELLALGYSGGTFKPWVADENGLWVSDYPESDAIAAPFQPTYLGDTIGVHRCIARELVLFPLSTGIATVVDLEFASALGGVTYGSWGSSTHTIWPDRQNGYFVHIGTAIDTSGGNQRYVFARQIDPDGTVTILDETASGFNSGPLNSTPAPYSDTETLIDFGSPDRFTYDRRTFAFVNLSDSKSIAVFGLAPITCYTTGADQNGYPSGNGINANQNLETAFFLCVGQTSAMTLVSIDMQDTIPDGSVLTQFDALNIGTDGLFASKPGALNEISSGGVPAYPGVSTIIIPEAPAGSIHSTEPADYCFRTS